MQSSSVRTHRDYWEMPMALLLLEHHRKEAWMMERLRDPDSRRISEVRLIAALGRSGPQTIEALSSTSGLSWSQVFLAIDRLSRSGAIALRPFGRGEYKVFLNETEG